MIQILVKEMFNISLQGWKGSAFMNFKRLNAKHLEM